MAFESEGFCVVRGPDLLWGGDVKRFHPPAGKFDGLIASDPCQAHSTLVHIVRANGYETAEDLTPEVERCVEEAQPEWFLRENVLGAPIPQPSGYIVRDIVLCDLWVGGGTVRKRRFCFGTRDGRSLYVETLALHPIQGERSVTGGGRDTPVKIGGSGKRKKGLGGVLPKQGTSLPLEDLLALQGAPRNLFGDELPFKLSAMRQMVGNGVPLPMGRAVALAVKAAIGKPSHVCELQ